MPVSDLDGAAHQQQRQPDVLITGAADMPPGGGGATVATLEPTEAEIETDLIEITETFVEVVKTPDRELVTTIELLLPANKHGRSREEYLLKRRESWAAYTNLLEIDLLLAGRRLKPESAMPAAGEGVCAVLSRPESFPKLLVYAWKAADPLPALPVPLLPPDPDVPLELRPLVDQVYDRGRYRSFVKYDENASSP